MNPCTLIQDLLPLYIDDAVSPESRALIDEHLAACERCRSQLEALRRPHAPALSATGGDADPAPSEDARFLQRLKRNLGTAIGAGLVLLVLTGLLAGQWGRWQRDRELGEQYRAEQAANTSALERLMALSADPRGILARNGIDLHADPVRTDTNLTVNFAVTPRLDSGIARVMPARAPEPGQSLAWLGADGEKFRQTGGSSQWTPGQGGSGYTKAENLPAGAGRVTFSYPILTAWFPASGDSAWSFRRPGPQGSVAIGERVTVHGIEFQIDQAVFDQNNVRVEYRQLTDPITTGVYYLAFRLSDGMGAWAADSLDTVPNPDHPAQEFDFVNSASQTWQLKLEYAVLTVAGASETLDIPAAR
jgi:hypothetical protein